MGKYLNYLLNQLDGQYTTNDGYTYFIAKMDQNSSETV